MKQWEMRVLGFIIGVIVTLFVLVLFGCESKEDAKTKERMALISEFLESTEPEVTASLKEQIKRNRERNYPTEPNETFFEIGYSPEPITSIPPEPNEADVEGIRKLGNIWINYADYKQGIIDVNEYVRRGENTLGKWIYSEDDGFHAYYTDWNKSEPNEPNKFCECEDNTGYIYGTTNAVPNAETYWYCSICTKAIKPLAVIPQHIKPNEEYTGPWIESDCTLAVPIQIDEPNLFDEYIPGPMVLILCGGEWYIELTATDSGLCLTGDIDKLDEAAKEFFNIYLKEMCDEYLDHYTKIIKERVEGKQE